MKLLGKREQVTILFAVVALGVGCAACSAESPVQRKEILRAPGFDDVSGFDDSDIKQIDDWLRGQAALAQYPSLSVAVVRDGKIAYQGVIGFEDVKARRKATPETSYHVASVTKVFTTLLAVQLDARGVVDLDQPAVKYLPQDVSLSTNPKLGATITLRQLASHSTLR